VLRIIGMAAFLWGLAPPSLLAQTADSAALRGVVRAVNEAAISTEVTTRVSRLPFREGEAFKHNDLLVEFDCDRLRAELKAADAERRGQLAIWENAARLYQMRAAGGHDVTIAAAAHDKAAATAEGLELRVKQCQILAPFDGRVVDLSIRKHETPASGQPLIRIVDDKTLEIDLLLPASSFPLMKVGAPFQLRLDETGIVIDGEITRVGGALDIVSQTFKASGRPKSAMAGVIPGMSGTITIKGGS
jgi:membrane fusion protein, multidrug efflux system